MYWRISVCVIFFMAIPPPSNQVFFLSDSIITDSPGSVQTDNFLNRSGNALCFSINNFVRLSRQIRLFLFSIICRNQGRIYPLVKKRTKITRQAESYKRPSNVITSQNGSGKSDMLSSDKRKEGNDYVNTYCKQR
mgnify:CR=1 FL=1